MTLPNWLLLITLPLGVARAMFFVMNDVITERPRGWVKGLHPKLEELLECPWCTGLWLSIGACVFLAWDHTRPLAMWALLAFALSLLIVLIERVIDRTPMLMDEAPLGTLPEHHRHLGPEPPDEVRAALTRGG